MNQKSHTKIWQDTTEVLKIIKEQGKNIVIITHMNPDGDAMGSSLALNAVFEKMGHTSQVIVPNDYPGFLKWLPGNKKVIVFKHKEAKAAATLKNADLIIAADFNDVKRVKPFDSLLAEAKAYKMMIDHHPDPDLSFDCTISDTSSSSTAEIVYNFIKENGLEKDYMDKDVAVCIYTGIMTDTGCFSFNSSEKKTYEAVASLLDYGFDKDLVYYRIYDNFSGSRMRLLGYCLDRKMEILEEFNTAIIALTRKELELYNFSTGDSEGFVNYPLSIKGIIFSAFFIEKEDHVKVSFRSKGAFPVNIFSKNHFNGGGHINASGGEVYMTMDEALSHFRQILSLYKTELNESLPVK